MASPQEKKPSVSDVQWEQKAAEAFREGGRFKRGRVPRHPRYAGSVRSFVLLRPPFSESAIVLSVTETSNETLSFPSEIFFLFCRRSPLKIKPMYLKKKSVSLAVWCSAVFSTELLNLSINQQMLSWEARWSLSQHRWLKTAYGHLVGAIRPERNVAFEAP